MTVVRGDAARRLMARIRTTAGHPPPLDRAQSWTASTVSPAGGEASLAASELIGAALTAHGRADRAPDATAVVEELVQNARQHGRDPIATTIRATADGKLVVEVSDSGPCPPALLAATRRGNVARVESTSHTAPHPAGTGLKVVGLLSQAWGVRCTGAGKTVWAQLHDHGAYCRGCHSG